jgi:hypothetical protein
MIRLRRPSLKFGVASEVSICTWIQRFLRAILDMHVLRADGAAVSLFDAFDNFPQWRVLDPEQRAGIEHRVEIGFAQVVTSQRHFLDFWPRTHVERIEPRPFVALDAVSVDQLQYPHLLGVVFVQFTAGDAVADALVLHRVLHLFANFEVILVRGQLAIFQFGEPVTPVFVDLGLVFQIA